jgi:hypothetical protein
MRQQDVWRDEYRRNRYMRHLNDANFKQRLLHVTNNMWCVDEDGKLSLEPSIAKPDRWMASWTHLLEEASMRGIGLPVLTDDDRDAFSSNPSRPLLRQGVQALRGVQARQFLAKFGKREHLEASLQEGRFRIAPAGSYNDPSLRGAVFDDELEVTVETPGENMTVQPIDQRTGKPKGPPLEPMGNVQVSRRLHTNFYVMCFTTSLDPRMFLEFDADACLVIRNPKTFVRRLVAAFHRTVVDWPSEAKPVRYVDPLRDRPPSDVIFSKHFRFAYQEEFRVAWLPPFNVSSLEPVFVDVGSLTNSAQLVILGPAEAAL